MLTQAELSLSLADSLSQPSTHYQDMAGYINVVSLLAAAMHSVKPAQLGLQFCPPHQPDLQARLIGGFDPEEKVPSVVPKFSELKHKPLAGSTGLMFWTREQYESSQVRAIL